MAVGSSTAAVAPPASRPAGGDASGAAGGGADGLWPWPVWGLVVALVLTLAVLIVAVTGMTPSFDPYGWLVWGHQVLHGHLDLDAAPSWKPLTFIFTLPYALFSANLAPRLWSVTAVAGALSIAVFAARIAYRLARPTTAERTRRRTLAAWIGALFAAAGSLGLQDIAHLAFIANSDPLNTALVLAAVDGHLSRRPRIAYLMLCLAALGRPEAWPFAGLYGLWLIWRVPSARVLVVAGWALIAVGWFVPTAIWSHSLFSAGNLDLGKSTACSGGAGAKAVCVVARWRGFYEWPMQVAGLLGAAVALLRRDRVALWLLGLALAWLAVEIGFALHGFSAVSRYLMEPAALMVALAGYAIAELVAGLPGRRPGREPDRRRRAHRLLGVAGPLLAVGVLAVLVPVAHRREYNIRAQVPAVRNFGRVIAHLRDAVDRAGGGRALLACGELATLNRYQSQLAYAAGVNVSAVFYNPPLLLSVHRRMVLFTQSGLNAWSVRPYNVPAPLTGVCARRATRTVPGTS